MTNKEYNVGTGMKTTKVVSIVCLFLVFLSFFEFLLWYAGVDLFIRGYWQSAGLFINVSLSVLLIIALLCVKHELSEA